MQTLRMLRPDDHDFDLELEEIQNNARETREENFWGSVSMLYSRAHWKQAAAALLIPWFQQFSGINSIMFYGESLSFLAHLIRLLLGPSSRLAATPLCLKPHEVFP